MTTFWREGRRSRFKPRRSKVENETLLAELVVHGWFFARGHQHVAQLQPSAQAHRGLRGRPGPRAAGEGTAHAGEVCVLPHFQEWHAGTFRERELEIARFRKTHEHFADQSCFPAVVEKLAIPGVPIERRTCELMADRFTAR